MGINPDKGGSPPSESRIRGVIAVRAGVLAQEVARELTLVDLFILNTRKVESVIVIYRVRVRRVREGENCRTRIIQPRCAMEE